MSFLRGQVNPSKGSHRYASLGYLKSPFPTQGEVFDVYVPRDELDELQQDLLAFLSGRDQGKVWALAGQQGVGKSNFLRMVKRQLEEMRAEGEVSATGVHLFHGNSWAPSYLIAGVSDAIGADTVAKLLKTTTPPPAGFAQTDFGRFWSHARPQGTPTAASEFLMRWLGGGQTYAPERTTYGITARDRLAPAIAVPYLRALVEMLSASGFLKRIILLFDELENVQAMRPAQQVEYMQLLKTLLNAFNWQGMYVILAGAPAVFNYVQSTLPSLAGRWKLIELQPLRSVEHAIRFAEEYKRHAIDPKKNLNIAKVFPAEIDIKAAYIDLSQETSGRVRQRDMLSKLHDMLEAHITKSTSRPPRPALRG